MATTGQVTDEQLVERARRGEVAAFGELVERHRAAVIRAAIAALGDREEAEDVAQETFVSAWQALSGYRGDASFRTWVLAVAWRRALTRRRSLRRWWDRHVVGSAHGEDGWSVVGEPEATGPLPDAVLMDAEFTRSVQAVVRSLAPKLRDPLLLAASRAYSMEEIGQMLGTPVGTVKWRVAEARRLLREKLERIEVRPAPPVAPGRRG